MPKTPGAEPGHKTVRASVELLHKVVGGEHVFSLAHLAGVAGPCDGEPDGAPCGEGCTCKAQQPWYSTEAIAKMGFKLEQPGEG